MNISTKQYVSFDKNTGEIFGIGPSINESYNHIEVTNEQVEPFQTLKENFINWKVIYNKRDKNFQLKKNNLARLVLDVRANHLLHLQYMNLCV